MSIQFSGRFTGIDVKHREAIEEKLPPLEQKFSAKITLAENQDKLTIETPEIAMLERGVQIALESLGLERHEDYKAEMPALKKHYEELAKEQEAWWNRVLNPFYWLGLGWRKLTAALRGE